MAARPPAFSPESTINHEGPFCASLVSGLSFWLATVKYWGAREHTMWLRRLAAPRPVGPMPMTRTSTLLQLWRQYEALYVRVVETWQEARGGVREQNIRVSHCESWIEALIVS